MRSFPARGAATSLCAEVFGFWSHDCLDSHIVRHRFPLG